jgi:hypothetical protein
MIQTYAQFKAALETYGKSRRQMPRMAEPENVSCKLTEQLRLSILMNGKNQIWRGWASSGKLYLVTSMSVLPGWRTRKTRSR